MSSERFGFGDRVRHLKRPEWGIGSVVKSEEVVQNGTSSQRLSVRFPGVGVKILSTSHADLQRVEAAERSGADIADARPMHMWDEIDHADWLAPVAQRKIQEAMTSLSEEVRDPFRSLRERLETTLALYRFDRTGRGLIEWAVAQSGLDDPLSRFNRHELERFFDRWAVERDAHLERMLQETAGDPRMTEEVVARATAAAQRAVRRLASVR